MKTAARVAYLLRRRGPLKEDEMEVKMQALTKAELAAIEGIVTKGGPVATAIAKLHAEIERLRALPMPAGISLRAVPRTADVPPDARRQIASVRAGDTNKNGVNDVASAIKAIHNGGGVPVNK